MELEYMVEDIIDEFNEAKENIPASIRMVAGDGLNDSLESIGKLLSVVQLMAAKLDEIDI